MAVALQDQPRVTMPQLLRDDVRRRAGGDHEGCGRVSEIMERQPVKFGASDRRPEDARHEVVDGHCRLAQLMLAARF